MLVALVLAAAPALWAQAETKLTAADGAAGDLFGESVSVSGDVVLVGASGDDGNGDGSGSAHAYRRVDGAWIEEEAKLTAADGAAGDWFGESVSVSGDVVLVGAIFDDDNGDDRGSAYVYDLSGSSTASGESAPRSAAVGGVFPVPASASLSTELDLPGQARVVTEVYDLLGRQVVSVPGRSLPSGRHLVPTDVSGLPSGVYVLRVRVTPAGGDAARVTTRRVSVVR